MYLGTTPIKAVKTADKDQFRAMLEGTIKGDFYSECTKILQFSLFNQSGITSVTLPYLPRVASQCIYALFNCKRIDLGAANVFEGYGIYNNSNLDTVIIRTPEVATMLADTCFMLTKITSGTGYIYVPDDLVEQYKVATNWTKYASQIKGISELEG